MASGSTSACKHICEHMQAHTTGEDILNTFLDAINILRELFMFSSKLTSPQRTRSDPCNYAPRIEFWRTTGPLISRKYGYQKVRARHVRCQICWPEDEGISGSRGLATGTPPTATHPHGEGWGEGFVGSSGRRGSWRKESLTGKNKAHEAVSCVHLLCT